MVHEAWVGDVYNADSHEWDRDWDWEAAGSARPVPHWEWGVPRREDLEAGNASTATQGPCLVFRFQYGWVEVCAPPAAPTPLADVRGLVARTDA